MKIVNRKIKDLKVAEYNPNEMTKKEHQGLKDSIKEFGMVEPIVINMHKGREDVIIGGNHRLRIWEDMGNKVISTVEVKWNKDK